MNRQQHLFMKIIEKIRVFHGLKPHEAQNLMASGYMKQFQKGDVIYRAGEPSNDMLVLIQGKLNVLGKDNQVLVSIPPGTSTGEMGLFTGQPRSATIVADEPSAGLVFDRGKLYALMGLERDIKGAILQNVVALLSERLVETDRKLEAALKKLAEQEAGT